MSAASLQKLLLGVALATALLLIMPAVAMQFTDAVQWSIMDFVAMSALLFGAGSMFVLIARKAPRKYRVAIGIVVATALLYVWAELAVGIFTTLGS